MACVDAKVLMPTYERLEGLVVNHPTDVLTEARRWYTELKRQQVALVRAGAELQLDRGDRGMPTVTRLL